MIRSLRLAFLVPTLSLFTAPARAADPLAGLDAQLEQMLAAWEVPGAAIGIVHEGKLIYARGLGVREMGKPDRVDPDTIFYAASTSKAVTALAAGLLVQEGQMAWDAPLAPYLPGLAFAAARATAEITLRDALSHRTGYATNAGALLYTGSSYTAREAALLARHLPRTLPHRSDFGYNNLMFAIVGEAVAAQSGQTFDDFLRTRFWQPLGMTRTFTRHADFRRQPNIFTPHSARGGPLRVQSHRPLDATGGAGFVLTSVNDYAKWIALLLDGGRDLFKPATLRAVWSPTLAIGDGARAAGFMPETATYAYGLGWFVGDFRGTPVKFHRGNWLGGMAAVGLLPEKKLGVVVFENRDGHSFVNAVVYSVFERFVPGPKPVDFSAQFLHGVPAANAETIPSRPAAVSTQGTARPPAYPISAYAGRYTCAAYGGEAVLVAVGDTLRITLSAHPNQSGTLQPVQGEVFNSTWNPPLLSGARLRFTADPAGRVTGFDFSPVWDRTVYTFVRGP